MESSKVKGGGALARYYIILKLAVKVFDDVSHFFELVSPIDVYRTGMRRNLRDT